MSTSHDAVTLLDGFKITLEYNDTYEALQGLYNMKIAEYSAAFQTSKSAVERETYGSALHDLIDARDLLNACRPDTLELGHLLLKRVGKPEA